MRRVESVFLVHREIKEQLLLTTHVYLAAADVVWVGNATLVSNACLP